MLTAGAHEYCGRTKLEHTYNVADISHLAETRGGSDIKAEEMTRTVNLWLEEMAYQLCDNNAVNTGYFQARLHVQGTFNASDHYDPTRHHLLFEFQQGSLMRKELELVDVEVKGVANTLPHIDMVIDHSSETQNQGLTPGGIVEIKGFNLKFFPDEITNGIFLVPVNGGDERVLAPVPTNKPQQLISQCPADIFPGEYRLEVRTTYASNGIPLKTLKVGSFPTILTIPVA
jgi:hypothetical protein